MDWTIRPYRDADLPGVLRLFADGGFAGVNAERLPGRC